MKRVRAWLPLIALAAAAAPPQVGDAAPPRSYDVLYDVRLLPTEGAAHVEIRVASGAEHLRGVRMTMDAERYIGIEGDGKLERDGDVVEWQPPEQGGRLRYRHRIDHLRDELSYDARCAKQWALFRGDDLVPAARVRTRRGATSKARLRLRLPEGWSGVTAYPKQSDGTYRIDHPDRGFDRPTGWLLAGKLGVLRERVAGVRVVLAGPVGHGVRRHDLLALLRWTLPALRDLVPNLPERLLVASAGDPMWRGGLSGPGSVYVHADRPLISRDGTSPLLHELFHTMTRARSGPGGDWIVEGLAELYSLELLRRSGTTSRNRYEKALDGIEEDGRGVKNLRVATANRRVTARAVTVLRRLDAELKERTGGRNDLDDVVAHLGARGVEITTELFQLIAEHVSGEDLGDFFERYAPVR